MLREHGLNVNGITLNARRGDLWELCSLVKEVDIDIFCRQEHRLDTSQGNVRHQVNDIMKTQLSRVRSKFGATPILLFKNNYKPDGTFIIIQGKTIGRIIKQGTDKWGRWSHYTMRGAPGMKLTVISAYQVVQKSIQGVGTITSESQQRALMAAEMLEGHDTTIKGHGMHSRQRFQRDLKSYIHTLLEKQHEILLLGDLNEQIDPAKSFGMNELILQCLLQDLHKGQSLPATYSRGRHCLDYAFGTECVRTALRIGGYESFGERFPTDHRPYFLDFEIEALFGDETATIRSYPQRCLQTSHLHQVAAYVRLKYEYLERHNVFDRVKKLAKSGNRHHNAEKLTVSSY